MIDGEITRCEDLAAKRRPSPREVIARLRSLEAASVSSNVTPDQYRRACRVLDQLSVCIKDNAVTDMSGCAAQITRIRKLMRMP